MTGSLRVALLSPDDDSSIRDLAAGLSGLGHQARLVSPRRPRSLEAFERRLRRRGYLEHLTSVPLVYAALRDGDEELAHVAHPAAVPAAVRWANRTGHRFVFHYSGVPDHADLMSRRKKLELMEAGVTAAAAVVATSSAAADAFRRWLGVEASVVDANPEPQAWADLYAALAR